MLFASYAHGASQCILAGRVPWWTCRFFCMWVPFHQRLLPFSTCVFPGSAAMLSLPVRVRRQAILLTLGRFHERNLALQPIRHTLRSNFRHGCRVTGQAPHTCLRHHHHTSHTLSKRGLQARQTLSLPCCKHTMHLHPHTEVMLATLPKTNCLFHLHATRALPWLHATAPLHI